MHALSRLIRDSYYERRIEALVEEDLDESVRLVVDQAWIDQKDREWQRQRERQREREWERGWERGWGWSSSWAWGWAPGLVLDLR